MLLLPRSYACTRCETPPVIDGRLDDPCWDVAPWTEDFVDIQGDTRPSPRFRTRAKMLWDDEQQCWHDKIVSSDVIKV